MAPTGSNITLDSPLTPQVAPRLANPVLKATPQLLLPKCDKNRLCQPTRMGMAHRVS